MPRKVLHTPPFPVLIVDRDEPFDEAGLFALLVHNEGRTLCVRSAAGHPNRGGYFFHVLPGPEANWLYDFEGRKVRLFDAPTLVRFMNHVCGRRFDSEMLALCQSEINLMQDETEEEAS